MIHFKLDDSVGFYINRTAIYLKRELLHAFQREGYNVTPEQWALLNRLWEEEGQSQVQLAERTFNDKPNVTRMVAVLERNGLVRRRQNQRDRRFIEVFLTDEGRALRGRLIKLAVDVLERALRGLDEDDVRRLKEVLRRIDGNLANHDRHGGTPASDHDPLPEEQ
jgi:MarR family transcriptional regulator, organic hydroperoxide resistance regulator